MLSTYYGAVYLLKIICATLDINYYLRNYDLEQISCYIEKANIPLLSSFFLFFLNLDIFSGILEVINF